MKNQKKPLSFTIINSVALNGGDAAILLAMIDSLKREFGEDTNIKVQAKKHEICKKYYPAVDFIPALENKEKGNNIFEKIFLKLKYPRILMFSFLERYLNIRFNQILTGQEKEIINTFRTCKNIISCGGGFLNDYYPLHSRMAAFVIARLYNCRYSIYAQSLGPFWKKISKLQVRWILENASLVTLRDQKSFGLVKNDLNIENKNVYLTADEAHLLAENDVKNEKIQSFFTNLKTNNEKSLTIGISVRKWEFKDIKDKVLRRRTIHRYHRKIMELCIHLIEKYNANIVFISTCQGRPEYFIDDSKFARETINPLPYNTREKIKIVADAFDPRELKSIMKNFDVFIGVRMHTLILALSSEVPCLGLGYEFKTEELFTQLDMSNYTIDLKSDKMEELEKTVDELIDNRKDVSKKLKSKIGNLQENAGKNSSLLAGIMRRLED